MTENQRSRKKLTKESLPSTRNCVAANFTRVTSIPTGLTIKPTSPLARLTPFSTLARRYTITNLGNLRFWAISSDFELYLSFLSQTLLRAPVLQSMRFHYFFFFVNAARIDGDFQRGKIGVIFFGSYVEYGNGTSFWVIFGLKV